MLPKRFTYEPEKMHAQQSTERAKIGKMATPCGIGTNGDNFGQMVQKCDNKYRNDPEAKITRWKELKIQLIKLMTTGANTAPDFESDAWYRLNCRCLLPSIVSDLSDEVSKCLSVISAGTFLCR